MHSAASIAPLALAAVLAGSGALAAPEPCSSDTFAIDGSSVAVQLCVTVAPAPPAERRPGAPRLPAATLNETFTAKDRAPLVRAVPLDAVPGDEPSRTIDDVSLDKLGIARTLHMTIAVRTASVRLEHALVVPGAVTLK